MDASTNRFCACKLCTSPSKLRQALGVIGKTLLGALVIGLVMCVLVGIVFLIAVISRENFHSATDQLLKLVAYALFGSVGIVFIGAFLRALYITGHDLWEYFVKEKNNE
jgi:hypothetical protein